jgi:hypothetical protein
MEALPNRKEAEEKTVPKLCPLLATVKLISLCVEVIKTLSAHHFHPPNYLPMSKPNRAKGLCCLRNVVCSSQSVQAQGRAEKGGEWAIRK